MPALIFDLDGTLIDTVYAHVFAWQRALAEAGLPIEGWRIHRRIGMSGGLFTRAVGQELGRPLTEAEVESIQTRHGELFRELLPERRPLPDAVELLADLGLAEACQKQPALIGGINVMDSKVTHKAVADAHGMPYFAPTLK